MNKRMASLLGGIAAATLICVLTRSAVAEMTFDPQSIW